MCDLFAMSSPRRSAASKSLPVFGVRGRKNIDGWGIGFFRQGEALVEKSAERIYVPGRLHDSFQCLARIVQSPVIIAHIRLQTSGMKDECHAHPFVLPFLGSNWIFAHNGKAPAIEGYETRREKLQAASDSARVFEYLRDYLLFYFREDPMVYGLFDAVKRSTARLLMEYPGEYNYVLSNGTVLFAFTNHRHFMILRDSVQLENALLLTTVGEGLSPEPWQPFNSEAQGGLLFLVIGGEIIHKDHLSVTGN